jgi:mono/diheme cytochrome c family protein
MRRAIAIGAMILCAASMAVAQEWKAPASAKATRNPVAKDAGIQAGKSLFESNCAMCHGNTGKGDGPVGAALNPKPRNLADKAVQGQADGDLFWKISEGRGSMPGWKVLPQKDRWSLVHYLRSLAGKK